MPEAPKVSVLLPCFNAVETLEESLLSLAAQSLDNFEVIAVDDGSRDATGSILSTWEKRDSRFRTIHQAHAGIIEALNTGLACCRGEYIARMDADDRAYPMRLEKQACYLDSSPDIDAAGCLVRGFPEEQVRQGFRVYIEWLNSLVDDREIRREMFVESPLAHPSVMMRKEALLEVGGYQEKGWPEDYDLWMRFYLAGKRFGKVNEVLLDWREYPERLTRADSRYSLENFLRLKAHYLMKGPLKERNGTTVDEVIIWGAGMMGRRLSKHLIREGAPLAAFVDIDPKKIGRTRRGYAIVAPEALPGMLRNFRNPVVLTAVGARGARNLIRARLEGMGLVEGEDWWGVA